MTIVRSLVCSLLLAPLACAPPDTSLGDAGAAETRIGTLEAEHGYFTDATAERLYDEMDFQRATQAYMWALPLVSSASIRRGLRRDLGVEEYEIMLYENYLDTKSIWFTGNNTTMYGVSVFDMSEDGPVVVEIPPGPSAGMLNDFWFRTWGIGRLGPDQGNGGSFLIVPPDYTGDLPREGYFVIHSEMNDYMFFLRGFVVGGDLAAAAELFGQVRIYPYSQRANPRSNRVVPVTGKYISTIEPEGLEYWRLLSEVLENNPVEERDRFFLAMLKPLGIERGKPFEPDERQRNILEEGARVGQAMAQVTSFNPRIEGAEAYPGTHWMHTFLMNTTEGSMQEAAHYSQLDERLHYLYLATWPAQAMNLPYPSGGQRYVQSFKDSDGNWLEGAGSYRLHVPAEVPAEQFWSVTVYDNQTRSMTMNDANRAAATSYDDLTVNADGSVDLYFGPAEPEGLANNWVDTSASEGWFVWFRFYGASEAFFDGSWRLPDFERID
ncbi:MAG: DUF1254 domain-containing protein [Gemmatimonadetes bacterium]|nr:DUF1254 domain-containing protein [Gemmatimonadota bacterium]